MYSAGIQDTDIQPVKKLSHPKVPCLQPFFQNRNGPFAVKSTDGMKPSVSGAPDHSILLFTGLCQIQSHFPPEKGHIAGNEKKAIQRLPLPAALPQARPDASHRACGSKKGKLAYPVWNRRPGAHALCLPLRLRNKTWLSKGLKFSLNPASKGLPLPEQL